MYIFSLAEEKEPYVCKILGVMTFAGHEFSDPCPLFLSAITASPYLKFQVVLTLD